MSKRDNLQWILQHTQGATRRVIDDINDDESLARGRDNLLHIRWQTGHIALHAGLLLRILGADPALPDGWNDLFGRGCDFRDSYDAYPTMDELRAKLYGIYDQINARLAEMDDNDLDRILQNNAVFNDTSVFNNAQFLSNHEFYHVGKIQVLRRILGRERPFG